MSLASESSLGLRLALMLMHSLAVLHHCQLLWVSTAFTQPLLTAHTHYHLDSSMRRANIRFMAACLIRGGGKLHLANQLRADVVLWSDGGGEKLGCLWMTKVSSKSKGNRCSAALVGL